MPTLPLVRPVVVGRPSPGVGPVRSGQLAVPGAGAGARRPRAGRGERRREARRCAGRGRRPRPRRRPPRRRRRDRRRPGGKTLAQVGPRGRRGRSASSCSASRSTSSRSSSACSWSCGSARPCPPPLVEKLETAIKEKKFQEAYDACRDNESFLARLVRTGIANLPNGRPEAKEAMNVDDRGDRHRHGAEDQLPRHHRPARPDDRAGRHDLGHDHELPGDRHAPPARSPSPRRWPRGSRRPCSSPSKASRSSVPAIFFFAFFRNRIALITMEATKVADRTINSLVAAAKQAKTA